MRKWLFALAMLGILIGGCASKKRVRLATDNPYLDPQSAMPRQEPSFEDESLLDMLFNR